MPRTKKVIPKIAILQNPRNAWSRELIGGVFAYANKHGPWDFWISPDNTEAFTEIPKGWNGDGVIGRILSPKLGNALADAKIPSINIADYELEGIDIPSVQTDDRHGSQLALQHFRERGIPNVAFAGPIHSPAQIRYARIFKEEAEKDSRECSTFAFKIRGEVQHEEIAEWLHKLPKPVAILVLGNEHARMIVNACAEIDINVPHDVSVLSAFYDEITSHSCTPPLSGIKTPTRRIGYRAAELLDEILHGSDIPPSIEYLKADGIIESLSTETQAIKDSKLIQTIAYIKKHAFANFTMQDLLNEVPMARSTLERRFLKTYGRSIFDEVKRIRINHARKLLAETDLKMQDIAEACGYSTYNNLGTAFKQIAGTPPSVYRKKYRH